jgi:hypothetical protein
MPGVLQGLTNFGSEAPVISSAFAAEREIKLQRSPACSALPVEVNFVLMVLSYARVCSPARVQAFRKSK